MRIWTGRITLIFIFLLFASELHARNMDGKFAIGYGQGLSQSGVSGLAIDYWVGYVKVGTLVGFDLWFPDEGEGRTRLKASLHAFYAVVRARSANLNIGIRGNAGFDVIGEEQATGLGVEIPIEVEFWVTEHVSLTGHVGLTMDILDGDENPLLEGAGMDDGKGKGVNLSLGATGFAGGVGFHFYF